MRSDTVRVLLRWKMVPSGSGPKLQRKLSAFPGGLIGSHQSSFLIYRSLSQRLDDGSVFQLRSDTFKCNHNQRRFHQPFDPK